MQASTVHFSLSSNRDVMTLLAELLSNQHASFAGVSKEWRGAWGSLPKTTQAIMADTSLGQLQHSFDIGLTKTQVVCERIAEHCGVEILQCAHANGCPLTYPTLFMAAARGKLDMIKWALNEAWYFRKLLCRAAAA